MANQEGARRGIFGIGAPPRERSVAPALPRPDIKPAPVPEPEKPPTKKPLMQRLVNNLALRIFLAGTALAGTGYITYQEVPAVHRAVDNLLGRNSPELVSSYDPNSDKPQIIKAGTNGNARAATEEEVQNFINETTPVPDIPKPHEQAPKIDVIFSVNPENAKEVEVTRVTRPGYNADLVGNDPYYVDYLDIKIKGENVPVYLPIVKGAKRVSATAASTRTGVVTYLELTYYLNNGQSVHARLNFGDTNYAFTDTFKSIPMFDAPSRRNVQIQDYPTVEFNLEETPYLDLFRTGSTSLGFTISAFNLIALSPSLATSAEEILYLNQPE